MMRKAVVFAAMCVMLVAGVLLTSCGGFTVNEKLTADDMMETFTKGHYTVEFDIHSVAADGTQTDAYSDTGKIDCSFGICKTTENIASQDPAETMEYVSYLCYDGDGNICTATVNDRELIPELSQRIKNSGYVDLIPPKIEAMLQVVRFANDADGKLTVEPVDEGLLAPGMPAPTVEVKSGSILIDYYTQEDGETLLNHIRLYNLRRTGAVNLPKYVQKLIEEIEITE